MIEFIVMLAGLDFGILMGIINLLINQKEVKTK